MKRREKMGTVENLMTTKERKVLEKVVGEERNRIDATSVERMDIILLSAQRMEKNVSSVEGLVTNLRIVGIQSLVTIAMR
jgi:hypothetical protein